MITLPEVRRAVVSRLPKILITDLWQAMSAIVWATLGLAVLIALLAGDSGLVEKTLSYKFLIGSWGASWLLGGAGQIIGIQASQRRMERLGISLSGLACTVYALTLFAAHTVPSIVLGCGFVVFALGHGLALLISSEAKAVTKELEAGDDG